MLPSWSQKWHGSDDNYKSSSFPPIRAFRTGGLTTGTVSSDRATTRPLIANRLSRSASDTLPALTSPHHGKFLQHASDTSSLNLIPHALANLWSTALHDRVAGALHAGIQSQVESYSTPFCKPLWTVQLCNQFRRLRYGSMSPAHLMLFLLGLATMSSAANTPSPYLTQEESSSPPFHPQFAAKLMDIG